MDPKITQDEIGIIKQAQAGNMRAFEKLFYKYKPFVENLLNLFINDMDEARDLTNVVFMKVYEKLSTFQDYSSFGGWLRIVTQRTAIDYIRREAKTPKPLPETDDEGPSLDDFSESNSEEEIVDHLLYKQIVEIFKTLPKNTQKVFELFYVQNMTVEQISEALGIPTGTIKSMLSRTRIKIKNKL